ncbi:SOS response-associated peptidase [Rhodovibrionaceae bacterium A322]
MCGRYTLTSPLEAVREAFGFVERPNLEPRFNIAPTQNVLAIRLREEGPGGAGSGGDNPAGESEEDRRARRQAVMLRWGLVPGWAKDLKIAARMTNARSETVAEKPAFRSAFKSRRCLIVADGFYEWHSEPLPDESGLALSQDGSEEKQDTRPTYKQPYYISLTNGRPFAFAGLWESWLDPAAPKGAPAVETCTILTTQANDAISPIHHRMPVILHPRDYDLWFDPGAAQSDLLGLMAPAPASWFKHHPVSTRINGVAQPEHGEPEDAPLNAPVDRAVMAVAWAAKLKAKKPTRHRAAPKAKAPDPGQGSLF